MVHSRDLHGITLDLYCSTFMVLLCDFHGTSMVFPWDYLAESVGVPWCFHGTSLGSERFRTVLPCAFHCIPTRLPFSAVGIP